MTCTEILHRLEQLGHPATAKLLAKHGAKDPCYGVKIEDLKKLLKQIKPSHDLALALFNSGVFDAMYLAGLIMDGSSMTKAELKAWAQTNYGSSISSHTVAWVASESRYGQELALAWIESQKEFVAVSGWATLSALVAVKDDEDLDLPLLSSLIDRVERTIKRAPNRVRQAMNNYLISVGCYVAPLTDAALRGAARIGVVEVDVGDTACKIPLATDYINKVIKRGTVGVKRKTVKC